MRVALCGREPCSKPAMVFNERMWKPRKGPAASPRETVIQAGQRRRVVSCGPNECVPGFFETAVFVWMVGALLLFAGRLVGAAEHPLARTQRLLMSVREIRIDDALRPAARRGAGALRQRRI